MAGRSSRPISSTSRTRAEGRIRSLAQLAASANMSGGQRPVEEAALNREYA
jgi:hypothetical protein